MDRPVLFELLTFIGLKSKKWLAIHQYSSLHLIGYDSE